MSRKTLISLLLRTAVGLPFLYAGVESILEPVHWIGYVPEWARDLATSFSPTAGEGYLLIGFAVFEILLAFWLLTGWQVRIAAGISAFILLFITATNMNQLMVLFRDIGLFLTAVALIVFERK